MIYQKYTGEIELKNIEGENLLLSKDVAINEQQEEIERLNNELELQNIEMGREIEKLKKETLSHHTKLIIAKGKQKVLEERIDKANEYIDQVLLYRIPKTKEVYEDIETLQNILNGSDKK